MSKLGVFLGGVCLLVLLLVVGCSSGPVSYSLNSNIPSEESRYIIEKVNEQVILVHFTDNFASSSYEGVVDKQKEALYSAIVFLSTEYRIQQVLPISGGGGIIKSPIMVIVQAK